MNVLPEKRHLLHEQDRLPDSESPKQPEETNVPLPTGDDESAIANRLVEIFGAKDWAPARKRATQMFAWRFARAPALRSAKVISDSKTQNFSADLQSRIFPLSSCPAPKQSTSGPVVPPKQMDQVLRPQGRDWINKPSLFFIVFAHKSIEKQRNNRELLSRAFYVSRDLQSRAIK